MMQMSARLLLCPRLAVNRPLSALRNVCLSYIVFFFVKVLPSLLSLCCWLWKKYLACFGKVVRLYVKSQKWPSESADLHFICLIMHLNKHFIVHHTQSKTLALLDFNKTCSNPSNHNLSCCLWGKRTCWLHLNNNHTIVEQPFSHVHCHSYAFVPWDDKSKQSAIYTCRKRAARHNDSDKCCPFAPTDQLGCRNVYGNI